jgi:hypothetical protein
MRAEQVLTGLDVGRQRNLAIAGCRHGHKPSGRPAENGGLPVSVGDHRKGQNRIGNARMTRH